MFRKIHSKRDPKDTLLTELRREFSVYITRADVKLRAICLQYPRQVYTAMVLLILASFVLSLTVFRNRKPIARRVQAVKPTKSPVTDGLGQISRKAAALQESVALKTQIESLIAKDSLNHSDSVALEKAIDRFHELGISN